MPTMNTSTPPTMILKGRRKQWCVQHRLLIPASGLPWGPGKGVLTGSSLAICGRAVVGLVVRAAPARRARSAGMSESRFLDGARPKEALRFP
jgi:hypothetical protein